MQTIFLLSLIIFILTLGRMVMPIYKLLHSLSQTGSQKKLAVLKQSTEFRVCLLFTVNSNGPKLV